MPTRVAAAQSRASAWPRHRPEQLMDGPVRSQAGPNDGPAAVDRLFGAAASLLPLVGRERREAGTEPGGEFALRHLLRRHGEHRLDDFRI